MSRRKQNNILHNATIELHKCPFTKSLHGMMQGVGTNRGKERGRRPTRRKRTREMQWLRLKLQTCTT